MHALWRARKAPAGMRLKKATQLRISGEMRAGICGCALSGGYALSTARISPEIRSCVAFFKRIPAGAFRARDNACIHHVDQLVLREMDRVGYRIARFLEDRGHWAFQTAAQETVWEMKSASYGYLSTRHVAIEAGLGTIGLELNLLPKEAGPRCYTTGVLTDAVLQPHGKPTEQLCIGGARSRRPHSCPPDPRGHSA